MATKKSKKPSKKIKKTKKSSKKAMLAGAAAGAAAGALAGAAAGLATATAGCTILHRGHVSALVLQFLNERFPASAPIGELTNFTDGLVVSQNERNSWATPLRALVAARGCDASTFDPTDYEDAEIVGDIIDALAEVLGVA